MPSGEMPEKIYSCFENKLLHIFFGMYRFSSDNSVIFVAGLLHDLPNALIEQILYAEVTVEDFIKEQGRKIN